MISKDLPAPADSDASLSRAGGAAPWIAAGLAAHTAWGAYPVLARYLQTQSPLPSMSIVAAGNLLALLIVGAWSWRRLDARALRSPRLLVFSLIVIARGVSNFLAARYTLAIYVQLINQMTPFVVALLSTAVLREKLPPFTGRAVTLCLLGSLLMMSGGLGQNAVSGTRQDWLGIGLALASTLFLALYMLFVRRAEQQHIPSDALHLVQLLALGGATGVISLTLGEDLTRWQTISPTDGLIFGALVLGVFVGANVGQIGAIRRLGAALMSSLLAWRMVSALILAALLLNERLTSLWQAAGALLVLATITWYLLRQR